MTRPGTSPWSAWGANWRWSVSLQPYVSSKAGHPSGRRPDQAFAEDESPKVSGYQVGDAAKGLDAENSHGLPLLSCRVGDAARLGARPAGVKPGSTEQVGEVAHDVVDL